MSTKPRDNNNAIPDAPDNQGEGNRDAARHYNQAQRRFVEQGKPAQAARDAAPRSAGEAREMQDAEAEGRSHAKEEDPALKRGADVQPRPSTKPPARKK